jgi:hypothetical protein
MLAKDLAFFMDYKVGLVSRRSSSMYIFMRRGNYKLRYSRGRYVCIGSRVDRTNILLWLISLENNIIIINSKK